jgi:lysophospholipase L1-like esterase
MRLMWSKPDSLSHSNKEFCTMILFQLSFTALVAATTWAQNISLRYMPLGDSITEATCWRAKLWHKFQDTEWSTVNFVGSSHGDNNCKDAQYDKDSEGHSGFLAINIASAKQTDGWLKNSPADVVTIHLGTNDLAYNHPIADIIKSFTTIITSIRAAKPKMKIIVSIPSLISALLNSTLNVAVLLKLWVPLSYTDTVVLAQVAQVILMMKDHAKHDTNAIALNQQIIPLGSGTEQY